MRRTSIWLIVAVLLATSLAAEMEGGVPKDPVGEARSAVDQFIRDFKPGMDTSDMNALTWYVRENCGALVVVRDYRIVKPYVQWLSDTVKLPDEARQNMLQTLGVLGDTAAAKVVMRYASDTSMSPGVRYEAAVAICFLGNAEAGTRVLENLALTNAVPHDALPAWQFFGSGNKPVKLKSAADEKALTLYMRWLAERATCENIIGYPISYLLQKGDDDRNFAFRVAERALQSPDVYLSGQNDRLHLLNVLDAVGGERGKALAAKYAK